MTGQRGFSRITGFDNKTTGQQWRQLGTTPATVTQDFYCLKPINGDAVLSLLTNRTVPTNALTWIDSATKTFYEGVYYPGEFTAIRVSSGEVIIYFTGP